MIRLQLLRLKNVSFFIKYDINIYLRTENMSTNTESSWQGAPLSEIYGSQSPWGAPEFPLVTPSANHTVLYHVNADGLIADDRPPKPQIGQDKWDHDYVRMPCSNQSLYPVEDSKGESHLKRRWAIIEYSLWKPIRNSVDLADTIISYNTKFKNIWKFKALHKLFNEYLEEEESKYFFDVTLPEIAKLALALPKLVQSPIPLLKQHKNQSISLSQQQIASLLANAFFCTFPRRNTAKKKSEYATYPNINFNGLYETIDNYSVLEKIKCICHYFRRVVTKVPTGCMTFTRRSVPPRNCPDWANLQVLPGSLPIHIDSEGRIEDAHGLIQVDFANKYLGGGVLNYGCVQEEIRFVICPELMISMLITEVLRPNEALFMIGCERYSQYTGYGSSFQFAGDFVDTTPRDCSTRRRCAVLAIDAMPYSSKLQEYRPDNITRELNKAWVGFSMFVSEGARVQLPGVASGNWGCGAFGGSERLKALLQLLAAACAGRSLVYYTFGDMRLAAHLHACWALLAAHRVTGGQLYKYIMRFCQTDVRRDQLYEFIERAVKDDSCLQTTRGDTRVHCDERMDRTTNHDSVIDIDDSSEPASNCEASTSVKHESPELFSQDELMSLNDVTMVSETDSQSSELMSTETTHDLKKSDTKDTHLPSVPSQTSRLFDEMGKLDDSSGRLNLNASHTSLCGQSPGAASNQRASTDRATDEKRSDPTTELKRKVARTIPFYFKKL